MLAGHITLKVFAGFVVSLSALGALGIGGAILPLAMTVALTGCDSNLPPFLAMSVRHLVAALLGDLQPARLLPLDERRVHGRVAVVPAEFLRGLQAQLERIVVSAAHHIAVAWFDAAVAAIVGDGGRDLALPRRREGSGEALTQSAG